MKKHLVAMGVLAAATLLGGAARPALATLQFTLSATGASNITVMDNGIGDTDLAVGKIGWSGSIGKFSTVITAGTSNSPGANGLAILETHTISVRETSASRETLTFKMTDTGFNNPAGLGLSLGSSFAGTFLSGVAGESVSFQSYADASNTPYGTAATAGLHTATLANGSPAPVAFNTADRSAAFGSAGPYSLTDVTIISLSQNGQANVSGTTSVVSAVPEPGTLSVLGLAAAGLLGFRRRRA